MVFGTNVSFGLILKILCNNNKISKRLAGKSMTNTKTTSLLRRALHKKIIERGGLPKGVVAWVGKMTTLREKIK